LVTYVDDGIAVAMTQAKAAAGDRNVLVHGATTAQTALAAGVLDELQIHLVPVLSGGGHKLFELLPERVELEMVRVIGTPEATHLRYRVLLSLGPVSPRPAQRSHASSACTTPCWQWDAAISLSFPSTHLRARDRRRPPRP
jgi:hypothetical protein